MNRILTYSVFSLLMVFAFSCTKEIQIDLPEYQPKLVVEGRIEPGQPPIVFLTKSKDIYAASNLNDVLADVVSGADVKVFNGTDTVQLEEICTDNLPEEYQPLVADFLGIDVEQLSEVNICAYTSLNTAIFGEYGRDYTLSIVSEGKSYSSITSILQPNPLDTVYFKEDNIQGRGFLFAELTDPAGKGNAYRWQTMRINESSNGAPANNTFQNPFNGAFEDDFFDGITFDFFFNDPSAYDADVQEDIRGMFSVGDTVIVKFSTIDYPVFQYLRQKDNQISTGGSPFASPSAIQSNIIGDALGVWAGYGVSFDTVICQ